MAIMGESGSGKTTLLNILAHWTGPPAALCARPEKTLPGSGKGAWPNFGASTWGLFFQDFNLLDTFSCGTIFFSPLVLSAADIMKWRPAWICLPQIGHCRHSEQIPYEVSGGQKQRAAVARALITVRTFLADEPTGALDSKASSASGPVRPCQP